jgi:hypothetical protein
MKDRNTELLGSWLGVVTLGERTLRPLGIGLTVVLRRLDNANFSKTDREVEAIDILEIVYVMYLTGKELALYVAKTKDEREELLSLFAAEHAEEIDGVMTAVIESAKRIAMATMESNNSGKETSHVS